MLPKLIMTVNEYTDYIVKKTCELLAIDSPTGYTRHAAEYLMNELSTMGYEPKMTVKGGVIVNLPGKDKENGLVFGAHIDTLGGMVHEVKCNGVQCSLAMLQYMLIHHISQQREHLIQWKL